MKRLGVLSRQASGGWLAERAIGLGLLATIQVVGPC